MAEHSVVACGLFFAAWLAMGGAAVAQVSLPADNIAQPSASLPGSQNPTAQLPKQTPALRLDAGDLLEITTFDTPDLSGKFRVDSRGNISLPLGGAVRVQGLTAEQVAVAVERLLRDRDILKNPHVTVLVLEYATQGVNVMGRGKTAGYLSVDRKAWRTGHDLDGGGSDAVTHRIRSVSRMGARHGTR